MYCRNCGKQNEDGARFCHYCGSPMEDNHGGAPKGGNGGNAFAAVGKSLLSFIKRRKAILIPAAAVTVLLIGFVVTGSVLSSPDGIAEKYVKALSEKNYGAVYDVLALPESEFLTKERFEAAMTPEYTVADINNYQIAPYDRSNVYGYESETAADSIERFYRVTYTDKKNNTNHMLLSLVQQKEKLLLFFPVYKVQATQFMADFTVQVPDGVEAALDGVKIGGNYISPEQNGDFGVTTYYIDAVFRGNHDVTFSGSDYQDYTQELTSSDSYYLSAPTMTLTDEARGKLEQAAEDFISELYDHALNGDSIDDFSAALYRDPGNDLVKDSYQNVADRMSNSYGERVDAIVLHSFSAPGTDEYTNTTSSYTVELEFTYDYDATVRESYWRDSEKVKRSSEEPIESSASVVFIKDGGEWLIKNFYSNIRIL